MTIVPIFSFACAADETKLWLRPSASQCQNPCPGPLLCDALSDYQSG